MYLPAAIRLQRRQSSGQSKSATLVEAIAIAVVALISILCVLYLFIRRLRVQDRKPRYIPTSFLKQKWYAWSPQKRYGQVPRRRSRELSLTDTSYVGGLETEQAGTSSTAGAGIDRNTSVRSVMTLPAYSFAPKDTEEVLGREGERAGMDTVVEFPETGEEEETRREEEADSLYQIRIARRRELAEREARRQERRDARSRGDWARLEELRQDSRARAATTNLTLLGNDSVADVSAATLLAEHHSRGRDRRVSTVSYNAVGYVKHDGTRLRANSGESERGGLLDGAAPMGEEMDHARTLSAGSSLSAIPRSGRDRSESSALSISTTASDLENRPRTPNTSSSAHDGHENVHRPQTSGSDPATNGTSESSPDAPQFTPELSSGSDIGESRIPAPTFQVQPPPNYDQLDWGDAPAYEAGARHQNDETPSGNGPGRASGLSRLPSRAPRLPNIDVLPIISIEGATEPNTPATPFMGDDSHQLGSS